MGDTEERLIRTAQKMHQKIFPCAPRNSFEECFTREHDQVFFWYNTPDRSTHIISADEKV
jgi:hypothetical protein